ncbi:hypothetical protein CI102_13280, partial [Trichoderma harzianum]
LPNVSAWLHLNRPRCCILTAYRHFMPARGPISWEGEKGSMLRLFAAYGRPATRTMSQLGIPQPKPMELLEGLMAHKSSFH